MSTSNPLGVLGGQTRTSHRLAPTVRKRRTAFCPSCFCGETISLPLLSAMVNRGRATGSPLPFAEDEPFFAHRVFVVRQSLCPCYPRWSNAGDPPDSVENLPPSPGPFPKVKLCLRDPKTREGGQASISTDFTGSPLPFAKDEPLCALGVFVVNQSLCLLCLCG